MDLAVEQFEHESWRTILGMGVGYVGLLALIFLVLFVVPFLVVWL